MQHKNPWLLPEGIEEVLPDDAKHLENLRRKILDVFSCWGYALVIPPFIDFIDSLLTGTGHDLDIHTFKLTDQLSGEMLGVRADMTPQVARIDAHHLQHKWPNRLCYAGTTLQTLGDALEKTRSPMQIGAEIYGHKGIESDIEIITLMLEVLSMSALLNVHLDLGHVGIFRTLSKQLELTQVEENVIFDILQRKAKPELIEYMANLGQSEDLKAMIIQLPELNGGLDTLDKAEKVLSSANDEVKCALAELKLIADKLSEYFPNLPLSFDLSELRGYHYHTGIVFAAFVPNLGKEIARGGRYDNIGARFGTARPATGFSSDLKVLSALSKEHLHTEGNELIFAPADKDPDLWETVRDLRSQGRSVLQELPGQSADYVEMGCTAKLEKQDNVWVVVDKSA